MIANCQCQSYRAINTSAHQMDSWNFYFFGRETLQILTQIKPILSAADDMPEAVAEDMPEAVCSTL